jgi:hypothetical protein
MAPDFIIDPGVLAAASFTGANSGLVVFTVPTGVNGAVFLGGTEVHTTAGDNPIRVKKIASGNTSAAGAAADANNVDISGAVATTTAANTPLNFDALSTGVQYLVPGDRVALASSLGVGSLVGMRIQLRFAWL